MNTQDFKRKLTAVFSADVAGYSRLMGEDEAATVMTLEAYKHVMFSLIKQHRGRVIDSPGDNLLAEFVSVVDAVQCGVAVQKELQSRNADLSENRRMWFRIGVNLGDVIEEGEKIYGDGVNIAARLESLAEPGGICISKTAFDYIESKLPLGYQFLGQQTVKNIAKPVGAYKVLMEPRVIEGEEEEAAKPAGPDKPPAPLPDKPSIAVLPFVNMSGDPEQEYFSDGMTEDLITDLSKIAGLFVIARNSVFTYKGKAVKVDQVGRELGVRYVLEGSVRKAGGRVRITAQLVDASTAGHMWAERYDRGIGDIFALQDEVTRQIVTALAVKLTEAEHEQLRGRYTDNLEAYDLLLRGLEYFYRFTKESLNQSRSMFESAIELDPQFSAAYGHLALTYWLEWSFGWSHDPETLDRAFELAKKTVILNTSLPEGHRILGNLYLWKKQHEMGIAEMETSIVLSPNDAEAFAGLGDILAWAGRPGEAIEMIEKAMRLNPIYPAIYLWYLGHSYFLAKRYEKAIITLNRLLSRSPDFVPSHIYLALAHAELGQGHEAQAEATKFLSATGSMTWQDWRERLPYKDQAVLERLFEILGNVGVTAW